jgi:hypothetical protein
MNRNISGFAIRQGCKCMRKAALQNKNFSSMNIKESQGQYF